MSLFCLLWMPLFYLFWRSITGYNAAAGGVWALLLGSIVALVQFFLGSMIVLPRGFGFSRWMSACIDIVTLPTVIPILVYLLLTTLKVISGTFDFANFTLLWFIPGAGIRAVSWSAQNDPVLLILVPLLWTAVGVGVPFFITLIQNNRRWVIVPASLAILVVPLAAASCYWAFYAQKTVIGLFFLFVAAIPLLVSMILSAMRTESGA